MGTIEQFGGRPRDWKPRVARTALLVAKRPISGGLRMHPVCGLKSAMRKILAFLWRPSAAFFGPLATLTLYFLSTGPFVWLFMTTRLPDWVAEAITYFYCPVTWAVRKSKVLETFLSSYLSLWVDFMAGVQPATPHVVPTPTEPPFFVEVSSTLVGAWFVFQFVRWINQHRIPSAT